MVPSLLRALNLLCVWSGMGERADINSGWYELHVVVNAMIDLNLLDHLAWHLHVYCEYDSVCPHKNV
jgi:hypothetical protein